MTMPFGYVSPEQAMRDKADYARKGVARGRSCVTLQYEGGILMVAPNASSALHKISELYDRIAFAAVGRYNEYENLRKAGVTYADVTGYQFDRADVTARGIANWYAQNLGEIFTASLKPFEVEIVVAEVGATPDSDQIYRITFDGSVSDEPGFVAFGGEADEVAEVLKERFSDGMSLSEALGAALEALSAQGNGQSAPELTADKLEVAVLDRARAHRTFRRLRGARLEELLAEARPAAGDSGDDADSDGGSSKSSESGSKSSSSGSKSSGSSSGSSSAKDKSSGKSSSSSGDDDPPTGPPAPSGDGIPKK